MDLSSIIGTKNADGTRVMPKLNIYGKPYPTGRAVTPTTIGVAPGKFVVVPANFEDTETLDKVRAALIPMPEVRSGRIPREVPANAGE